jgi:hypothetical protein
LSSSVSFSGNSSRIPHPLANMVVALKEFAVDKWFVPLLFVAATLVIGWGKVPTGKSDKS